ncbi:hypothetical protein [Priestia aryabhattai]|uniref:hypothetical protein n=1 Tax=Priestia aryabhattai TaxID=412384 RepID=UPI000BF161C7|nr:hypothetical protein [Priestia aryabhattai]PEI51829.1 hypothetical protein CN635_24975 [Priestia aryabhattai]
MSNFPYPSFDRNVPYGQNFIDSLNNTIGKISLDIEEQRSIVDELLLSGTNEVSILEFQHLIPNKIMNPSDWDISAALQAANNSIVATGKRGTIRLNGIKARLNSLVQIDISYVQVEGGGAILNASNILNGPALQITGSKQQNSLPTLDQSCAYFSSFSLQGNTENPRGNGGTIGIKFDGERKLGPSGCKFIFVNVAHFERDLVFLNNAYLISFFGCSFSKALNTVHAPANVTNAGERISFSCCEFANSNILIKGENPHGSFHFSQCSFDYPTVKFFEIANTQVFLTDCHIEGNGDLFTVPPFTISGNGATLVMRGGKLLLLGNNPSYQNIMDIQAQSNHSKGGGVLIDGVFIFNVRPTTGIFASGDGFISIKNWFSYDSSQNFAILSMNNNCLIDGSFKNASLLDNWFISADTSPITNKTQGTNLNISVSDEEFQSPGQSLMVKKLTFGGQPAKLVLGVPILNNEARYASSFYYKKSGSGVGTGKVYVDMKWAVIENNKDGVPFVRHSSSPLSSSILDLSSETGWENIQNSPKIRRPSWATNIILEFNLSQLTTGTTFYIDDVFLGEL